MKVVQNHNDRVTNKKQQNRFESNTWLELQNTPEDDKFPNTSSPCAHLETGTKKFQIQISHSKNKKKKKKESTMGKSVSLGAGKGVITRGLWDSSSTRTLNSGLNPAGGLNPVIIRVWEYKVSNFVLCE